MASQLKSVTLCNLCEKVYDPTRLLWVKVKDYRAYHDEPADSYAFAEALCNECHTLYSAMIRRRTDHATGSIVGMGFIATSAIETTPLIEHGLA